MADRLQGTDEEHARPDISHHVAYLSALVGRVAMDLTPPAAPLRVPFGTMVETFVRIFEQAGAVGAQVRAECAVMAPAIDGNHHRHCLLLPLYPVHA